MTMMMRESIAPYGLAPAYAQPLRLPRRGSAPRRSLRALALAPVARADGAFVLPTHPVHNALRRGLLIVSNEYEERVRVRVHGHVREVRVHTRMPAESAAPVKGANLLKSHLDLVDQAYRRSEEPEGFVYDMADALTRLGYKRLAGGGFHGDTVKEHLRRLQALASQGVAVGDASSATPVWRFVVVDRAGGVRPLESAADWATVKASDRLLVLPGGWWDAIELPRYRLAVPRTLLSLPLDGQGNQVNRVALQLAAELAVWERAEMRQGPHRMQRRVGVLLERAMVAEKATLVADAARRLNTPKRLREYLAGDGFPDQGALAVLRELGRFDVDIADEAAFWAAGRGWVERFWDARLTIGVRAMNDRPLASFPTPTGELADTHWRVGAR
ncbi:hypothetical protein D3C72_978720 [compost metagenome]